MPQGCAQRCVLVGYLIAAAPTGARKPGMVRPLPQGVKLVLPGLALVALTVSAGRGEMGRLQELVVPIQQARLASAVYERLLFKKSSGDEWREPMRLSYDAHVFAPVHHFQAKIKPVAVTPFVERTLGADSKNRPIYPGRTLSAAAEEKSPEPAWIKDPNGCAVWSDDPQPNQTITWSGPCVNGKAHGRGAVQWFKDGEPRSRYEGEMLNGKPHGRGIYTGEIWDTRFRYEGEWRDGKWHGRGVITSTNGSRYEGEVRDSKMHGRGVFTWANGSRYEGEWRDSQPQGRGIKTSADGSGYEGEWRDGKLWNGTFTKPDGHKRSIVNGKWTDTGEPAEISADRP